MRIGISTSVIQRGKTGVAQYVFALVRALLETRGNHRLILFVLEDDKALFDFANDKIEIVSVSESQRPAVKNILWHQFALPALVKKHRLDVLHVPSYRRMLWRRVCPLVATIHDLAPFHVANKYDWKRMFYGRVVVRHLAHRQHEIIAISNNTAQDIERFFSVSRDRINVIHNGLDHDRFSPDSTETAKAEVARRYQLQKPFFLYVARLEHPGKNHVPLIHAFNRFKKETGSTWQLILGGSDWHGADAIHSAIKQSPCSNDIRCLGFVPDDRLPNLYRAADVFVYPSLFEGFGLPPVEAMACGCPVICSARGSLGEVVGSAAAIVDPDSVESMAKALQTFASDNSTNDRFRAWGFVQARKFNWQKTAAQTLKVYERAMAASRKRHE